MLGLLEQLSTLEDRYRELSLKVIDPSVIADADAYRSAIRDFKQLEPIVEQVQQYKQWAAALEEAQADQDSDDAELREMAAEEAAQLKKSLEKLRRQLQEALVPDDPSDGRDCVIEVRAGTGGDEAALWAGPRRPQRWSGLRD